MATLNDLRANSALALAEAAEQEESAEHPAIPEFDWLADQSWKDSFVYATSAADLEDWLTPVLNDLDAEPLAWDVETNHTCPWRSDFIVTTFSFAHRAQPKPLIWTTSDYFASRQLYDIRNEPAMLDITREVIQDRRIAKIAHNGKFDENAVFNRYKWKLKGFFADTFLLEYCRDPVQLGGRGLDDLIIRYFPNDPRYWELIPEVDSYATIPPHLLLPYAAKDTHYTRLVYHKLIADLARAGDVGYFVRLDDDGNDNMTETYGPLQYAVVARAIHHLILTHMEQVGTVVDRELVDRLGSYYTSVAKEKAEELSKDPRLQEFERTRLVDVMAKDRFRVHIRDLNLKHGGKPRTPLAKAMNRLAEIGVHEKPTIKWTSLREVRAFFVDFLGMPIINETDSGDISTDEQTLRTWAVQHGCKPAELLLDFRAADKFLTSYIHPMVRTGEKQHLYDDGKLHPQLKAGGIRTGRIASGSPNLHALPRDGLVKRLYVSRFGNGWVLQRDYSGLEVRVLALMSRDPKLVEAFRTGGDPHFNTQLYFFGEKADKSNKTQRSCCKQALFGRIYGQGDNGLMELLHKQGVMSPDTGRPVTIQECAKFNQMIDEVYPGVKQWVAMAHASAIETRRAVSAFGFQAPLPLLKLWRQWKRDRNMPEGAAIAASLRHSQNYPIQSTASDITIFAAYRIQQIFFKRKMRSVLFLTVHDAIYVDSPEEEVVEAAAIMQHVMDNSASWLPELLPGYDASWIDLPIIGEQEIGISIKDALAVPKEPSFLQPSDSDLIFALPSLKPEDGRFPLRQKLFGDKTEGSWDECRGEVREWLKAQRLVFSK